MKSINSVLRLTLMSAMAFCIALIAAGTSLSGIYSSNTTMSGVDIVQRTASLGRSSTDSKGNTGGSNNGGSGGNKGTQDSGKGKGSSGDGKGSKQAEPKGGKKDTMVG